MKKKSEDPVKFTQQNVLHVRREKNIVAVEKSDWERLISMINKYSKISLVWWAFFTFFLSLALDLILNYFALDRANQLRPYLVIAFAIAITAAILFFIFALFQKNTEEVKKEDILTEMERMKNTLNEEIPSEESDENIEESKNIVEVKIFKIIQANYGVENNSVSVTDKLNSLVEDNKLITKATNSLVDKDPAPGIKKYLEVEYENNGEKLSQKYNENDPVNLP